MDLPATGEVYRKNGWDVQVHEVRDGMVYVCKFRAGEERDGDLIRMALPAFLEQVRDAACWMPIEWGSRRTSAPEPPTR